MPLLFGIAVITLVCVSTGFSDNVQEKKVRTMRSIVTSDTILSGMIASLLPSSRYNVKSILPPGQCPGHYDIKLSDVEKMKKADLTVSFRGMGGINKAGPDTDTQLFVDAGGRNWMAPVSYIYGLSLLANELSKFFPEDMDAIMSRKKGAIRDVKAGANLLVEKIKRAGISGKPMIASDMQKEPLEWMGFRVAAEYGRPEAMSARELVRLVKIGKDQNVMMVVDNLQSGPDAGKGIAEALGVPHVVLTNFPSEKGYLATLGENVNSVLSAAKKKR